MMSQTVLAVALVLWASVSTAANVKPGDRDYPQQNPNPTKFLFLHGTIDPSLDLNFQVAWHSDLSKCHYATSIIEGAYAWYSASTLLEIKKDGTNFSARIPIDGVLPGRCQWSFGGVDFGANTGYRTGLVATNSYPLKPGQSPNGIAELHCKLVSINRAGWPPGINPNMECRWPASEDVKASVLGGQLWWHPEATDFEVHFIAN
jgi:hypothetical protein